MESGCPIASGTPILIGLTSWKYLIKTFKNNSMDEIPNDDNTR